MALAHLAEQLGRGGAAVEQLAVMGACHLDVDRAGFEHLADHLVRLLGGELGPLALGDVDRVTTKPPSRVGQLETKYHVAVGMLEFLLAELGAVPAPARPAIRRCSGRDGKLVALGGTRRKSNQFTPGAGRPR